MYTVGDSNQQWQLDYSYGRDRRNQIRSMTSLGVCQEHPDTWNGDHPEYVSCPIGASLVIHKNILLLRFSSKYRCTDGCTCWM
jgi:hypothetical protein